MEQEDNPTFGENPESSVVSSSGGEFSPLKERLEMPLSSVGVSDIDAHSSAMKFSKNFVITFLVVFIIVFGLGLLMSLLYPADSKKPWILKLKDESTGQILHVKIDTPFYEIVRPEGSPNSEIFKIVWPVLFLFLTVSATIMINQEKKDFKYYSIVFLLLVQFSLLFAWIPVFNKLHKPRMALYILVSLIMSGSFTAVLLAGVNIYAGAIWAILLAWLSYALNLNISSVAKYEEFVEKEILKLKTQGTQIVNSQNGKERKIELPPLQ
jgi:tryptophan-rich sensory protein